MQANEIEAVGALPALMYGAAQFIGASMHTSLSYVHQYGGQQDLLLFRTNETLGLIIAYNRKLGLGCILYNARRCAAALGQILGT
jgi:predicted regulator of Ras-like GTPase activity (Roadblock/LC7/MglB family)